MPRPPLPVSEKLSEVTFVKLRRDEKRVLTALSRKRRQRKQREWSVSAIMRSAFLEYLQRQGR